MSDGECRTVILVVDDEPEIRGLILAMLRGFDARLHEAPDGAVAAEMLDKVRPDVIITDLKMPRMDGFELCRLARGNGRANPPEVIAVTGEPFPENVARIKECGARACLSKPFEMSRLVEEIQSALACVQTEA